MENTTTKPPIGTWANMTDAKARPPKVTFELDKTQNVVFVNSEPREGVADDGSAYYTFDVMHNEVQTVIQTSAWTLLGELAKHHPLEGKKLSITKKMEKGKQYFVVIENK